MLEIPTIWYFMPSMSMAHRSTRGIVMTQFNRTPEAYISITGDNYVDDRLRRYALYWDRIELPTSANVSMPLSSDARFLESAGILTSIHVVLPGAQDIRTLHPQVQLRAFMQREAQEPGCWSVAEDGVELSIPNSLAVERRTIEVELIDALLEPDASVPLEKILEFKARRASELTAFRGVMDEQFERIISSGDISRAKVATIDRSKRALDDLNRVMGESFLSRVMHSLKVDVIPSSIITSVVSYATRQPIPNAWVASLGLSSNAATSIIGGAAIVFGCMKLSMRVKQSLKNLPDSVRAFSYAYNVQRKLRFLPDDPCPCGSNLLFAMCHDLPSQSLENRVSRLPFVRLRTRCSPPP